MLRIQGCGAERRAIDGETCVLYCRNELLVRGRDIETEQRQQDKIGTCLEKDRFHGCSSDAALRKSVTPSLLCWRESLPFEKKVQRLGISPLHMGCASLKSIISLTYTR